jgi:hypothetical protein
VKFEIVPVKLIVWDSTRAARATSVGEVTAMSPASPDAPRVSESNECENFFIP